MKVLLVTTSFPPADGAELLPALGIETHVLVPDDSVSPNGELAPPTQAFVHRVRSLLPGVWFPMATQAAVRLVRREGIDTVITTSPPASLSLAGAAVKRLTGISWVADLRGSDDQRILRLAERFADGMIADSAPGELAELLWSLE